MACDSADCFSKSVVETLDKSKLTVPAEGDEPPATLATDMVQYKGKTCVWLGGYAVQKGRKAERTTEDNFIIICRDRNLPQVV